MNKESWRILFIYINIILLIILLIISMNYAIFIYFVKYSSYIREPEKTIKNIAIEFEKNDYKLTSNTINILKEEKMWVQVINRDGEEIYSFNKPEEIGNYYSIKDIAVVSKNYLKDYPVFLWGIRKNLIILGYSKNSMDKYNLCIPVYSKYNLPIILIGLAIFNLLIVLIISYILLKVYNKPIYRIINAISSLKEDKKILINEKGIYKNLASSINKTSKSIRAKNESINKKNGAIDNWIKGISHDVRTPLSMILGYASIIEEDKMVSLEVQEEAKIITENSLRIKELIENLNLATSLQYNMQPLKLTIIRLSNIAREAVTICINGGILKKCKIDLIIDDNNIIIEVDKDLIIRALINAISNSVKHNKNGCNIKVTVTNDLDNTAYSMLIISDDGIGVDRDKLRKINEKNYCGLSINQRHGLGLIIIKNIIKVHGGKFIVRSEYKNGFTIILKLPRQQEVAAYNN